MIRRSGWFSLVSVEMVQLFNPPMIVVCIIGFFICAVFWSVPVYYFIRWRRDATARLTDKAIAKVLTENNEVEMKTMEKDKSAVSNTQVMINDPVVSIPPSNTVV